MVELFHLTPKFFVGCNETIELDSAAEGSHCPLEVLFLLIKKGHFLHIFGGLFFVVGEVNEVLVVEFSDFKRVDFLL